MTDERTIKIELTAKQIYLLISFFHVGVTLGHQADAFTPALKLTIEEIVETIHRAVSAEIETGETDEQG